MSLKPNLAMIPEKDRNPFTRDVERTINGGVTIGDHGFNFTTETTLNSDDSTVIRYKKGPRCRNLNGQYILLDVPDAAIGTFLQADVQHDLKRIPQGIKVVGMSGVNKAAYPYTTSNAYCAVNTKHDDPKFWNKSTFRITIAKVVGAANPTRIILVVF